MKIRCLMTYNQDWKRHNLRDCLQPRWKDFLSGETTLHQDEKKTTSEVDSLPKMLDLI